MSLFSFFGGGPVDAYNDGSSWFDMDADDGDLSQAFDALECWGLDAFEAADVLDSLVMEGVSTGELDEVVDGFGAEVTDELMGYGE